MKLSSLLFFYFISITTTTPDLPHVVKDINNDKVEEKMIIITP